MKQTAVIETITPEIAKEYLKFNRFNRPISAETVSFYAEQLRKGLWRVNGEAICFAEGGALLNGQHRLEAIVKSGVPMTVWVIRGCENDSMPTYDSGRTRKVGDVFGLHGIKDANKISSIVSRTMMIKEEQSFILGRSSSGNLRGRKKISKAELLDEYYSSVEIYKSAGVMASTYRRKLGLMTVTEIGGLMAYLIKFKMHDESVVIKFFDMLFDYKDLTNSTINDLRNKIIRDGLSAKKMSPRHKSAIITKAWNYYIQGRLVKNLSWSEEIEGHIRFL